MGAKPPVFAYAGVTEDVEDTSVTFDELRIAKSEDFPELDDGKRVSWTVEYGKITKPVPSPRKKTVAEFKSEIETSKEFLDSLKKAKDKSPACKLVPKVTAQSKGKMSAYKGIFPSFEEAEQSGKIISLFPSGDGNVYEMRKTESNSPFLSLGTSIWNSPYWLLSVLVEWPFLLLSVSRSPF